MSIRGYPAEIFMAKKTVCPSNPRPSNVQRIPESWNMGLGGFVLGSLILYLKGMRRMMFQLSGFYYRNLMKKPWPYNRYMLGFI